MRAEIKVPVDIGYWEDRIQREIMGMEFPKGYEIEVRVGMKELKPESKVSVLVNGKSERVKDSFFDDLSTINCNSERTLDSFLDDLYKD